MKRRVRSTVHSLLILGALTLMGVGCSDDDSPTGPTALSFTHSHSFTKGGLELTVSTEAASYAFAEDFQIRVRLSNLTDKPQTLDFFRGTPARYGNLTVNINDTADLNHFAASDGERDQYELAPGASITSTFTWDQYSRTMRRQVDPGVYEVIASVGFDDRDTLRSAGLYVEID